MQATENGVRWGFPAMSLLRVGTLVTTAVIGLFAGTSVVSAEPVLIATFGGVSAGGSETSDDGFGFLGVNFSIGGLHVIWEPAEACAPCTPGTSLNLSSIVRMVPGPLGFAHIDGVISTQPVDFIGTFAFNAGSIHVPEIADGGSGTASAPFTFLGTLAGFADAELGGVPLFATNISGSGIARLEFVNAGAGVMMGDIFYELQDPAATPEPASLLLFGSGAALLAARRRYRRTRSDNGISSRRWRPRRSTPCGCRR